MLVKNLLFLLVLTSCEGSKDDSQSAPAPAAQEESEIVGTWNGEDGECVQGQNFSILFKSEFKSTGEYQHETATATDGTCATRTLTRIETGTFHLGQGEQDGEIDMVLNSVKLAVYDDSTISSNNQTTLCGVSDWTAGTFVETLGTNCAELGQTQNKIVKGVFKVENDILSLALDSTGNTRATSYASALKMIRSTTSN